MRTTLKDIAKYLNVSTTTVSRALNDKDDISTSMRQKVLEVAKMLDYKPNSIAISLRKKTTNKLIGVVMPVVNHYFFSTILRGITTTSQNDDYMIMIGESNHDAEREKEIINRFGDHYVSGIILVPSRSKKSNENVQTLTERRTPFILIDRTFKDYDGSYIQHDDYQGAYIATQHLISKGRKRIGMLRGDNDCSVSAIRLDGYIDALKEHNIPFDPTLILSSTAASKKEGYQAMETYLKMDNPPDGIFAITDQLAAGALSCSYHKGLSVPKDISLVGYSNSDVSEIVSPTLTTISQDGFEMGRLAKEYLIEMCHHENVIRQKVFPAELIVRESS